MLVNAIGCGLNRRAGQAQPRERREYTAKLTANYLPPPCQDPREFSAGAAGGIRAAAIRRAHHAGAPAMHVT